MEGLTIEVWFAPAARTLGGCEWFARFAPRGDDWGGYGQAGHTAEQAVFRLLSENGLMKILPEMPQQIAVQLAKPLPDALLTGR